MFSTFTVFFSLATFKLHNSNHPQRPQTHLTLNLLRIHEHLTAQVICQSGHLLTLAQAFTQISPWGGHCSWRSSWLISPPYLAFLGPQKFNITILGDAYDNVLSRCDAVTVDTLHLLNNTIGWNLLCAHSFEVKCLSDSCRCLS